MKAKEYRQMSSEELAHQLEDIQRRFFDLKGQSVTQTLENSKALKNMRREIARLKTIINEVS